MPNQNWYNDNKFIINRTSYRLILHWSLWQVMYTQIGLIIIYLSILSLSLCKRRWLSASISLRSLSMNTRRSRAPSFVTSITLLPCSSACWSALLLRQSNNEVVRRSNVGNLSIAAHCNSTSSSLLSLMDLTSEVLLKLDACWWKEELTLLPISAAKSIRVSNDPKAILVYRLRLAVAASPS